MSATVKPSHLPAEVIDPGGENIAANLVFK